MSVWALSDLHLSFGIQDKRMDIFGPAWENWTHRIQTQWTRLINNDDLVLIAGDISWAMRPGEAAADLQWIDALPGTKLLLKGNHDYWWPSTKKLLEILPPSIHCIHNNAFHWNDYTIGGTRLWDSPEYSFTSVIDFQTNPKAREEFSSKPPSEEDIKIFERELLRLKLSLDQLSSTASYRIAMTHYPPIGLDLTPSKTSAILDAYNIDYCIFGHLHNVNTRQTLFGKCHRTHYLLTSCDYLQFTPLKIL